MIFKLTFEAVSFSVLAFSVLCISHADTVFNVMQYGAVPDSITENTKAFMHAWEDSCKWQGKSSLLIPPGSYLLGSVIFTGPCNGPKEVLIQGVLRAPTDPKSFFIDHWISFKYIDGLTITGGGTLDGQGAVAWPYNTCHTGSCKPLPVSMRFDFINNSDISNIKSLNSKNFHFNIFACYHMNISNIVMSAPGNSPNTDGIHMGGSGHINIRQATISTGDDCISISPGTTDIHISESFCGSGHGISVGSMGKSDKTEGVSGITVVNCNFSNTLNGVQIKTWPETNSASGYASDFTYQNIFMQNVQSPIFINQNYCPSNLCNRGSSQIQVSQIRFSNIWGTSASKEAVKLECSQSNPCKNIVLEDINLEYVGRDGPASSTCFNVHGISKGVQKPPSCMIA